MTLLRLRMTSFVNMEYDLSSLEIFSPAKINIGLEIGPKRYDQFHEISSLMVPLQLEDSITISIVTSNEISVRCLSGTKYPYHNLPQDSDNICHRTVTLFLNTFNINSGLTIKITKNIPVAAGLGGGSSNAASVLMGLNKLFNLKLTISDLLPIAEKIGSDVPFFLYNSPAIVEGRGEKITKIELSKPLYVILINPGFPISTADAFSKLDSKLTASTTGAKPFKLQGILAFKHSSSPICLEMLKGVKNCFEEVIFADFPELGEVKGSLYNLGSDLALMTGSGPTVFALFSDKLKAGEAYNQLKLLPNWLAFLTRSK